jgi:hypothetical protein
MRISLLVVIALLLAACASAGSNVHVVSLTTWAQTPTVPDAMKQRVEDTALDYQQNAPVPRVALFDIAYPSSDAELVDMAGYGVLLLTTLSQNHDELPPKRLYVVIDGIERPLAPITATKTTATQSPAVAKVLGSNRWDGLYLFPVYLTRDDAALSIDFAANRSGFILGNFSDADQKTLNYSAFVDSAPTVDAPSSDAVMRLVGREFPGFIGRAP